MVTSAGKLYVGTASGVFTSADTGNTWSGPLSATSSKQIQCLQLTATHIFGGSSTAGIYRAAIGDTEWVQVNTGLTDLNIRGLALIGTTLYAGTSDHGVFASTDNGDSWTATNTGLTSLYVRALYVYKSALFAGTATGGIFVSIDGGAQWTGVNQGLIPKEIHALLVIEDMLYAAGYNYGVWKRELSEVVTAVAHDGVLAAPASISLLPNYPNPFNPSTTIMIRVNGIRAREVRLVIVDILGREIRELLHGTVDPGEHLVRFDAKGLGSGTYYCRLTTGTTTEVRRMLLVR